VTAHLGLDRPSPDLSNYRFPEFAGGEIERFSAYVREELSGRGFAVLYVPAAIPRNACERSPAEVEAFVTAMDDLTTGGGMISDFATEMASFCLASDLFFDGAGHLDADGRALHTGNVAGNIERFLARGNGGGRAALAPGEPR
jgi:hypothetical protein